MQDYFTLRSPLHIAVLLWMTIALTSCGLWTAEAHAATDRPLRERGLTTILVAPGSAVIVRTRDGQIIYQRPATSRQAGRTVIDADGLNRFIVLERSGEVLFRQNGRASLAGSNSPRTRVELTAAQSAIANSPHMLRHRIVARIPPPAVVAHYTQLSDACRQLGRDRCLITEFRLATGATERTRADLTLWLRPADADRLILATQQAITRSGGEALYDEGIHRRTGGLARDAEEDIASLEERIVDAEPRYRDRLQGNLAEMRQRLAFYRGRPPRSMFRVSLLGQRAASPAPVRMRWAQIAISLGVLAGAAVLLMLWRKRRQRTGKALSAR